MSSFNKVILLGRLTRDPELRVTANGNHICKFSIATSRKFKGSDGVLKEETTFVDVDTFGRQAEVVSKYFSKGKPIFVEGRLRLDQWESQNGEKRSKLTVVLENFQFIGSREDEGRDSSSQGANTGYEQSSPPARAPEPVPSAASNQSDIDEDVPF